MAEAASPPVHRQGDEETKDATIVLTLSEEKLIKRLRQKGNGLFLLAVVNKRPMSIIILPPSEVLG